MDKINLAYGNWLRAPVGSNLGRRQADTRHRNSDSSVPSGQGEGTNSPKNQIFTNYNQPIEDMLIHSDEMVPYLIPDARTDAVNELMEIAPNPIDFLDSKGVIEAEIESPNNTQVRLEVFLESSEVNLSTDVHTLGVVEQPANHEKGIKQWKQMARGKFHNQINRTRAGRLFCRVGEMTK